MKFEDLRVLQAAEAVADNIWRKVVRWDPFARETVGGQLASAADSIGANIASQLSDLARQLNAFAASLKTQRRGSHSQSQKVSEASAEYVTVQSNGIPESLFSEDEL